MSNEQLTINNVAYKDTRAKRYISKKHRY